MQENILEHTTSIAGLTCKPLSILSETISPQEMSMARGGDGMGGPGGPQPGQDPDEAEAESWQKAAEKAAEEQRKPKEEPGLGIGTVGGTYIPSVVVSGSPDEETFWTQNNVDTTAQADSSGTQDQNGGALVIWDLDFLDDDTEDECDECTVPYDCGYDEEEEEEDYSEDETEEDTEVYDP